MSLLEATIANIKELDLRTINEVKDYQNKLTKPQGSLGGFRSDLYSAWRDHGSKMP